MPKVTLRVGARDSQLSILQAQGALDRLAAATGLAFTLLPFSSPGDRDQKTDLQKSPGDFFTRDLDEALLRGDIDCAIHSAKDLPPEGTPEGIDWFWLPWREDPRDCLVARTDAPKIIGVSSGRREAWTRAHFPEATLKPLRGAIPARLAKLDAGEYDAIVIAAAALLRLGLQHRITRYLSLEELPPPPGQGILAMTFRRADPRLRALRNLYIRAVRFIGAGVGDAELCTLAGARELRTADVVIYDALMDASLLEDLTAEKLYVGKRSGAHALPQAEITALIGERVRRGQRVVRLKGGDPGLFGRLAEETDALAQDGIPFRVWPGVSALAAATTATGLLLTRRGESKGFTVETPRSQGDATPTVYFMGLACAQEIAAKYAPETPCAIIYDAGAPQQEILRGTVGDLLAKASARDASATPRPGLIVVGKAALGQFPAAGALGGRKIWITGSPSVAEKARCATTDFGGTPVVRPLVHFEATDRVKIRPSKAYNLLVVTSPTAAQMLLRQMVSPIQYLPKRIAVTGPATAEALAHLHIDTLMPEKDFTAKGLLAALPQEMEGWKVLRIRSEEASASLAEAMKARGAKVKDLPIYRTLPNEGVEVPPHDAVFLASSSAAKAWLQSGAPREGVDLIAMGEPTAKVLRAAGAEPTVVAPVQTVHEALAAYALHCSQRTLFTEEGSALHG